MNWLVSFDKGFTKNFFWTNLIVLISFTYLYYHLLIIIIIIIIIIISISITITIIIIIIIIIELTHSKSMLENTVEIEPQPVALDFKNPSQYCSHSK